MLFISFRTHTYVSSSGLCGLAATCVTAVCEIPDQIPPLAAVFITIADTDSYCDIAALLYTLTA